MPADIELEGVDIAFIGSFAPAGIQPEWFKRRGLLDDDDESWTVEIIHPDITKLVIGGFSVQVVSQRANFSCGDASEYESLLDFAIKTVEQLPGGDLQAVGINFLSHSKFPTGRSYDDIVGTLCPPDRRPKALQDAGVAKISFTQPRDEGATNVQIEPSTRVKDAIYVAVNEHFPLNGEDVLASLQSVWQPSLVRARTLVDAIMGGD